MRGYLGWDQGWERSALCCSMLVFLNRMMERVPADDCPAQMALHNRALNLGVLCGVFMGRALAHWEL
jgi:hypothetical protein